jgi:hypothetical protein
MTSYCRHSLLERVTYTFNRCRLAILASAGRRRLAFPLMAYHPRYVRVRVAFVAPRNCRYCTPHALMIQALRCQLVDYLA